jgi:signal peptidase II
VSKVLAAHLLADGRPHLPVGGFWDLELTRNPGGAFGILPQSTLLFFLATLLIVGGVLVWGLRSGQAPLPLGLIAGGGLGNLIDRVTRAPGDLQGRVVDFIHFHFWPTFNLADSAIVIGVALLILNELRPHPSETS